MKKIVLTNPQKRCAKVLLECIAKGEFTITYKKMNEKTGIPVHKPGNDVGTHVGEVSKLCHQLGLPLISVMVVKIETNMCGDGFYDLCIKLNVHPEYKDSMEKMMEACMNDVKECKQWHILADEIGLVIDGINKPIDTLPETVQTETVEGALIQITATAYERDPALRNECLSIHGTKCKICGFDAAQIYGKEFEGKIHVHHITPLGEVKQSHKVDPNTDLVPVCPNCHMILHSKKQGTYTPEEVIKMLNDNRDN
ncbi:MAG: HNH endonuclease [Clostridia bacterium]|nr:HNH endonuclease [Clostridia bacterium]